MNPSKDKLCIIALKYVPIIGTILMTLHVAALLLGYKLFIFELSVLTIVTLMVILWSKVFKFCLIHRLSSLYTIAVLWCCYIERYIGFGKYLQILRVIFLYLGIILLILLTIKYAKNYKKSAITDS